MKDLGERVYISGIKIYIDIRLFELSGSMYIYKMLK
jgi:hypothetical protein